MPRRKYKREYLKKQAYLSQEEHQGVRQEVYSEHG